MSDLDEKGLAAATAALCGDNTGAEHKCRELAEIAISAYKAEEFDWQAAYLKEHADLCAVEGRNYVLEQRIKVLEAADVGEYLDTTIKAMEYLRKALGEE